MKNIQEFIEAMISLIIGIILIRSLPAESGLLGLFSFGLILLVTVILTAYWGYKNFVEDYL